MDQIILKKLENMLGSNKYHDYYNETLKKIGKEKVHTMEDVFLFSEEMIKQGGIMSVVGRSIKITARLNGVHEILTNQTNSLK